MSHMLFESESRKPKEVLEDPSISRMKVQEKLNGERAFVYILNEKIVTLRGRGTNSKMLSRFPELKELRFSGINCAVLDAEICVMQNGKSIFYGGINQRRGAMPPKSRVNSHPVVVCAFDIIGVGFNPSPKDPSKPEPDYSMGRKPYRDRHEYLMTNFAKFESEKFIIVRDIPDPKGYWYNVVVPEDREGLMIKDPNAPYSVGARVKSALKLKNYKSAELVVEEIIENNKGAKMIGHTAPSQFLKDIYGVDKFEAEVQWSFSGWESINVGDKIPVKFLLHTNGKLVQPHKEKGVVR